MPTVCIQCAMKAMLAGEQGGGGVFEETPEAHMKRVHPDPAATHAERKALEAALALRLNANEN